MLKVQTVQCNRNVNDADDVWRRDAEQTEIAHAHRTHNAAAEAARCEACAAGAWKSARDGREADAANGHRDPTERWACERLARREGAERRDLWPIVIGESDGMTIGMWPRPITAVGGDAKG